MIGMSRLHESDLAFGLDDDSALIHRDHARRRAARDAAELAVEDQHMIRRVVSSVELLRVCEVESLQRGDTLILRSRVSRDPARPHECSHSMR